MHSFQSLEPRLLFSASPNLELSAGRLIFSQTQGAASRAQYVTLRNTGSAALSFNSIQLTGANASQFYLRRKGLPETLAPGQSATMKVSFTPTVAGVDNATVQIITNDPDNPNAAITLRGLGTGGRFNAGEPSLQRILDALQIPVNVGDASPSTSPLDGGAGSEEIPMQLLRKAGPGLVRITPLAAYSWDHTPVADFGWYRAKGSVVTRALFSIPGGGSQTLMPGASGATRFDPGSVVFGIYSNWPVEQHGNVFTQDALNTWDTTATDHQHKVRFYPFRKASGRTVPNTYVMAVEQAFNSDFQDAVLVIENVMPYNAVVAPAPVAAVARSSSSIEITWGDNNAYEGSYVVERSRKKNGVYSVIATTAAGVTRFLDTQLAANTRYYYRVRAVNGTGSAPSVRVVARTPAV
jgi:hypothetical protein